MELVLKTGKEEKVKKDPKAEYDRKCIKGLKYRRAKDFITILFYKALYKRRYKDRLFYWKDIKPLLNTPQKAFAWFSANVKVMNNEHEENRIRSPQSVMKSRVASDKTMAFLYANLLHHHGYRTYVFWCGYRNGYIYPTCAVIEKRYTTTVGYSYNVHYGDQFAIMKDYFEDGSQWKVVSRDGAKLIMSYMFGRGEYGSSDILIYDDKYWVGGSSLSLDLASKMRLKRKVYDNATA